MMLATKEMARKAVTAELSIDPHRAEAEPPRPRLALSHHAGAVQLDVVGVDRLTQTILTGRQNINFTAVSNCMTFVGWRPSGGPASRNAAGNLLPAVLLQPCCYNRAATSVPPL